MRSIFKLCLSSSLLSALDIFKTPIYLLFDKQPKTSTKTGIFCTIVITVLLTIMTSRSDIFQKKSPKLLISDLPVPTREKVEFSRKILAVGLQDEETGLGYEGGFFISNASLFLFVAIQYYFIFFSCLWD